MMSSEYPLGRVLERVVDAAEREFVAVVEHHRGERAAARVTRADVGISGGPP
jgi:hypothetical protein